MAKNHTITFGGHQFLALHGQLLLDAALSNGIDLPYDCRAGHCGTCCVRLLSGEVQGGEGAEPGVIHACQCRVMGDVDIEKDERSGVHGVEGVLSSLRQVSNEVVEVGIRTDRALPYLAGQYAQVRFDGFPSRPFSITQPLQPLRGVPAGRSVWFHVRQMKGGHVTASLGKNIKPGHRVKLTGPYGSAHFRPNQHGPLILVASNTGFAPIWSIAIAALRENPKRVMMIIAGGRAIDSLYMWPALVRLANFPNVQVVPYCSARQTLTDAIRFGRPTDFLPTLQESDVIYACGAPEMVDSVKKVATRGGAVCYADAFQPTKQTKALEPKPTESVVARTLDRLASFRGWQAEPEEADRPRAKPQQPTDEFDRPRSRPQQPMDEFDQPRARPQQSMEEIDRPHARPQQSTDEFDRPRARPQQSTDEFDRPRARLQQSMEETDRPSTRPQQSIEEPDRRRARPQQVTDETDRRGERPQQWIDETDRRRIRPQQSNQPYGMARARMGSQYRTQGA
jgi:NAD(P)H-flavin reductase/ferredoxin